jgi:hypothetical protein
MLLGTLDRPTMTLENELKFFETHKAEWLQHYEGKYVVVRGEEVGGFFDTAESAYTEALQKWGHVPFLIKPVLHDEVIEHNPAYACGLIHASF